MKDPEYLPLWWEDVPEYEVIRGHADPATARAILTQAAKGEACDTFENCADALDVSVERYVEILVARMEQVHARWVRAPAHAEADRWLRICPHGRGPFPATIFRVDP